MVIKRLVLSLVVMFFLPAALAEVKVTIDRNPVQVNESFQMVFSLDHTPDRDPDFSALQRDFQILGNSRSTSISIINGQYQRSVKWTLQLIAKQVGEYEIPAIRFDKEVSEAFNLVVQPSSLSSVPHDQLIIELEASPTTIPVQGQVILTLRLLSSDSLSAYQFGDIVIEDLNAVIEPLGDDQDYQTRIADKSYLVVEKRLALFPQKTGQLKIAPIPVEVRLASSAGFDPFQNGGKIRRAESRELVLDVTPVPAEAPPGPWLPAKELKLSEQWQGDLNNLVPGEPVTRTLTLVAEGLNASQLPDFDLPTTDGIKQYPDQPDLQNARSPAGIAGRRIQKVALIPSAPGEYELPAIEIPWWNTQFGKMQTAIIPARKIRVEASTNNTAEIITPADPSAEQPIEVEVYNPFWLWVSVFLAAGWLLTAMIWWFQMRLWRVRRNPTPSTSSGLSAATRNLLKACDANDAPAARYALLEWGRAYFDPVQIDNLQMLGLKLGEDFMDEINRLNRCLYASNDELWQGQTLKDKCQGVPSPNRRNQATDRDALEPLVP
ncbi:MAG: BatD family protein [Pseudomonadota bacterium]